MALNSRQQLQLEEMYCDRHICLAACACFCRLLRMSGNEYFGSCYTFRCPFRRSERDRFWTGAPSTANLVTKIARVTLRII
jgi:hypothetical protein